MALVKLGWNRMSVAEKLIKGDYIVAQMTANVATFPTPLPSLEDVTVAITALRDAATRAEAGGYVLTFEKNLAQEALDELMRQLTAYVQNVSGGDAETILLSGMEVRRGPEPKPAPTQIQNLNALPSRTTGQIDLNWDTLGQGVVYQVEQWMDGQDDDEGFWSKLATPSKSKYTVTGLNTGTVYRFRVAGIGTDDRIGPFSQDATSVAP